MVLHAGEDRGLRLHEVPGPEADRTRPIRADVPVDRPSHGPDRREFPVDDIGLAGDSRNASSADRVAVQVERRDKDVGDGERREEVPESWTEGLTDRLWGEDK